MTLCGDSRKEPILSGSSAGFVWESEAWSASSWDPGCKSRGWNIVPPRATAGPEKGSRALLGPGKGHSSSSCQGWFPRKPCDSRSTGSLSCFHGKTRAADSALRQRQRCQLRAGWGMTSATEKKNGFWIASHFAKYQVCPSERSLTQAT